MQAKVKRTDIRDHYVTTGQVAKILGVSKWRFFNRREQYRNIDRIQTSNGYLWNIFDVYKHKFPEATRTEIQAMILADRDRIQIKRERKKNVKHI